MTDGLLPGADRDLVNVLAKRVNAMCEAVLLKTKVVAMKEAEGRDRASRSKASCPRGSRTSRRSTACWCRSAAGRTPPCPASTRPR